MANEVDEVEDGIKCLNHWPEVPMYFDRIDNIHLLSRPFPEIEWEFTWMKYFAVANASFCDLYIYCVYLIIGSIATINSTLLIIQKNYN